jgi:hypothetical protein
MPETRPSKQATPAVRRKKAFTLRLWRLVEQYLEQLEGLMSEQIATHAPPNVLSREIGGLVTTLDRLLQLEQNILNPSGEIMMNTRKKGGRSGSLLSKTEKAGRDDAACTDVHTARITQMRDALLKKLEKWTQTTEGFDKRDDAPSPQSRDTTSST